MTLLRSAARRLMFSLDDRLRTDVFLYSLSSAYVGTENKKKIKNKKIYKSMKRTEDKRREGEREDQMNV